MATGTSPAVFDNLPVGTYTITVTLAGYRPVSDSVTIADGCDITKPYALVAEAGKLTVTTTPPGANVTVTLAG